MRDCGGYDQAEEDGWQSSSVDRYHIQPLVQARESDRGFPSCVAGGEGGRGSAVTLSQEKACQ